MLISGRIQTQNARAHYFINGYIFFIFKWLTILCSQLRTNRAKSYEFALIGVMVYFYDVLFPHGSYSILVTYRHKILFEGDIDTKINLHTVNGSYFRDF